MATRSENKLKLISTSELIAPTSKALTDLGNAERLIANHDEELRYCDPLGGWLFWDGSRWRRDESGQVYRWAIETARAIYTEASTEEEPEKRAKLASALVHGRPQSVGYKVVPHGPAAGLK